MIPRSRSALVLSLFALASLGVACGGSTADPVSGDDPELAKEPTLATADFPALESPGAQLDPIGCRHYQVLHVGSTKSGPHASIEPKLDSADPSFMDPDGSCGGEELPKNITSAYPLKFVERTSCGAAVYEGTIKWTTSGKVTRTMRLTDYRIGKCTTKPARLVADITSSYLGETNKIATYYSVDPR